MKGAEVGLGWKSRDTWALEDSRDSVAHLIKQNQGGLMMKHGDRADRSWGGPKLLALH